MFVVFVYVRVIFVKLGMFLGSVDFVVLQVLLLEPRLSIVFQHASGLNLCILCFCRCCCRRVFDVGTVERVLIFVGDAHYILKQIQVCNAG